MLKEILQVDDKFPISNRIKYSWDSRKRGSGRILARLDRIYFYIDSGKEVSCNEYRTLGDSTYSDHLPVWRQLELVEEDKRKSTYVMSNLYLKDAWVQGKVREIWNATPSLSFFGKLRKCVKFYKDYCI